MMLSKFIYHCSNGIHKSANKFLATGLVMLLAISFTTSGKSVSKASFLPPQEIEITVTDITPIEPNENGVFNLLVGQNIEITATIPEELRQLENLETSYYFTSNNLNCDKISDLVWDCEAISNGPAVFYLNISGGRLDDDLNMVTVTKTANLGFYIGEATPQQSMAISIWQTANETNPFYGEKNREIGQFKLNSIRIADVNDIHETFGFFLFDELKYTCSPQRAVNNRIEKLYLYTENWSDAYQITLEKKLIATALPVVNNGRVDFKFTIQQPNKLFNYSQKFYLSADIVNKSPYPFNYYPFEQIADNELFSCGVRTEEDLKIRDYFSGLPITQADELLLGNFGYAHSPKINYPRPDFAINSMITVPGNGATALQTNEPFSVDVIVNDDQLATIKDISITFDQGHQTGAAGRFTWHKDSNQVKQIIGFGDDKMELIPEGSGYIEETFHEGELTYVVKKIVFKLKPTNTLRTGYQITHRLYGFINYKDGAWPKWTEVSYPGVLALPNGSADFEAPYGRELPDQPWEIGYGQIRAEINDDPVLINQPTSTTFFVKTSSCINVNRLDYRNNYLVSGKSTMGSFYAGFDQKGNKFEGYYKDTWGGDKVSFAGTEFSYNETTGECAIKFNWTPKTGFSLDNKNSVAYFKRLFNPYTGTAEIDTSWTKLTSGVGTQNDGTFSTSL